MRIMTESGQKQAERLLKRIILFTPHGIYDDENMRSQLGPILKKKSSKPGQHIYIYI